MKSLRTLVAFGLAVSFVACAPARGDLNVGDPAPPLSIVEWVKGKPVDLKRDAKKRVHVIEFWAVWCPPCKMSVPLLTDIQAKHKNDVVIVGVTEPDMRGNTPSAVRDFVKQRGKEMEYTVAIDDGKTAEAYLLAAGAIGIPHAFVVDKSGTIVWQGSPLDPELATVVGDVVAGTFDLKAAKVDQEVAKRFEQLNYMAQLGQWKVVWEGLVEIMKLDPSNGMAMGFMHDIAVQELKDPEAFKKWVRTHIDEQRGHAHAMRNLADALCSIGELGERLPDLALEAARAAYDVGRQSDAASISAYALAVYQVGGLERAIALQQDALAVADGDQRDAIKGTLDYYRACKKLQGTLR